MTLSLPRTGRFAVLALAAVSASLTFGAATTASVSAQSGPYYVAKLAQPTDEDRAVAGGVAWACQADTCVANKGTSRPSRICRGLVREFGEITSFRVEGEELAADKLARCNGN